MTQLHNLINQQTNKKLNSHVGDWNFPELN